MHLSKNMHQVKYEKQFSDPFKAAGDISFQSKKLKFHLNPNLSMLIISNLLIDINFF